MGKMIEFATESKTFQGYLAEPASHGPGIIVIQEWWGLVGHIKSIADRFADAGFNALAPDFYDGKATAEPDEAGSLMMALDVPNAAQVIKSAVTHLLDQPKTNGGKVGVVGFCMGGQLSLFAAGLDSRIGACVDYYGIHPNVQPDYAAFNCPVLGFFAEKDDYASPDAVRELDRKLTAAEVTHDFHTYVGTDHAFFNDDRPEVYNQKAAEDSWQKMIRFFEDTLR